uniref:Uncharacterized protein n=1 Tax=Vitis vinifera TaxID=29760 RepID=F6GVL8_VITVI
MGLSNFHSPAEGVLPVLVMNTVMSVALLKNMVRSVLQVMGANGSSPNLEEDPSNEEYSPMSENAKERRVSVTQFKSLSHSRMPAVQAVVALALDGVLQWIVVCVCVGLKPRRRLVSCLASISSTRVAGKSGLITSIVAALYVGKEGYHYLLELQIISGQIRSGHDIPVCGSDLVGGHIQCCPRSLISAKSAETRYRRRGCVLACTIHNFAASTVEGTSSDSQANTRNLAHGWELQEGRKGHYQ